MARLIPFALVLLAGTPCVAAAQTENRTPIDVVERAQGILAERLVFELKEQLRASHGLRLSSDAFYRVHLIGMDDEDGHQVAYSVVWTYKGLNNSGDVYSDSTVGLCGSKALAECARSVVARTDKKISDDGRYMGDLLDKVIKENPSLLKKEPEPESQ